MPKVDVSVEQLRSVYGQLHEALDERAALHLPGEADDTVGRDVRLQLQEFLAQVLEMASSSMRVVNAEDNDGSVGVKDLISKSQERYVEPFDLELNERVRQAYREWEDCTVQVAQLRRDGPKTVDEAYVGAKDKFLAKLDAQIAELEKHEGAGVPMESQDSVDKILNERVDQYESSLTSLHEAQSNIPQIRTNLGKIKSLVAYLEDQLE